MQSSFFQTPRFPPHIQKINVLSFDLPPSKRFFSRKSDQPCKIQRKGMSRRVEKKISVSQSWKTSRGVIGVVDASFFFLSLDACSTHDNAPFFYFLRGGFKGLAAERRDALCIRVCAKGSSN